MNGTGQIVGLSHIRRGDCASLPLQRWQDDRDRRHGVDVGVAVDINDRGQVLGWHAAGPFTAAARMLFFTVTARCTKSAASVAAALFLSASTSSDRWSGFPPWQGGAEGRHAFFYRRRRPDD